MADDAAGVWPPKSSFGGARVYFSCELDHNLEAANLISCYKCGLPKKQMYAVYRSRPRPGDTEMVMYMCRDCGDARMTLKA